MKRRKVAGVLIKLIIVWGLLFYNSDVDILNALYIAIGIVIPLSALFSKENGSIKKNRKCDESRFTDRVDERQKLIEALHDNKRIINIHGVSGSGKSMLSALLYDAISGLNSAKTFFPKMSKSILKYSIFHLKVGNEYSSVTSIQESMFFSITESQEKYSSIDALINVLNEYKTPVIFVFDNFNNISLRDDFVKSLDSLFLNVNDVIIIINSQRELSSIYHPKETENIYIGRFDKESCHELAEKINPKLSYNDIEEIREHTSGLPIILNLIFEKTLVQSWRAIKNSPLDLPIDISSMSTHERDALFVIAAFSYSKSKFELNNVDKILNNTKNRKSIDYFTAQGLINPSGKYYEIHDTYRNSITYQYAEDMKEVFGLIARFYADENEVYVFYKSLETPDDSNLKRELLKDIQKAISTNDYSYLYMIYEISPVMKSQFMNKDKLSRELVCTIEYAVTVMLMNIGYYDEALIQIKSFKQELRQESISITSDMDVEYTFIEADCLHLTNKYSECINLINDFVLNSSNINENQKLKSLYLSAHCLRHMGDQPQLLDKKLDTVINLANKLANREYIIRALYSKSSIEFMRSNELKSFEHYFFNIDKLCDDSVSISTQLNVNKYKAIYSRISGNLSDFKKYADVAYEGYKMIKSRLQYNLLFEYGEYYRCMNDFSRAKEQYRIVQAFSQKNNDYNLEIYSFIGILICDISENMDFVTQYKPELKSKLIELLSHSDEFELHLAHRHLIMMKNYIFGSNQDDILKYFEKYGFERETSFCRNHDSVNDLQFILL